MTTNSYNNGHFINELSVKPGQLTTVIHYRTQQGYYQNLPKSLPEDCIPQAAHNYDIVVRGPEFGGETVEAHDLAPDAKVV